MSAAVQEEACGLGSLELQQLPPSLIVAIYDCLEEAGEVLRAATICKTIWNTVKYAQFGKVASIHVQNFHSELQHRLPQLAQQFPAVQSLNLSNCSALPERWLQPAAETWRLTDLDVTQLWHWTGGVCLHHWASTLTRLVVNDTSFPLLEVVKSQGAAATGLVAAAAAPAMQTSNVVESPADEHTDGDRFGGDAAMDDRIQQVQQQQQQQRQQRQPTAQVRSDGSDDLHMFMRSSSPASTTAARDRRSQQQVQGSTVGFTALRTQQQQRQPDGWLHQLRHLRELHLSGLVRHPIRCRTHGGAECDCEEDTVLSALLSNNSSLTHLNLSCNPHLPDRLLRCALTGTALPLITLDLSGCDLIKPGYLGTCCCDLQWLDVSNTAAGDADVALIAAGFTALTHLSLKGCRQVSSNGLSSMAAAAAVVTGRLRHLNIGDLTRSGTSALVQLITTWTAAVICSSSSRMRCSTGYAAARGFPNAAAAAVGGCLGSVTELHLGLSYTAGVSDAVLGAITAAAAAAAGTSVHLQSANLQKLNAKSVATDFTVAAGGSHAAKVAHSHDAISLEELLEAVLDLGDDTDSAVTQTPAAAAAAAAAGSSGLTVRLPSIRLSGLELASCNNVTGIMLQHLAGLGVLSGLRVLDLSDMEDLKSPRTLSPVTGTAAAAAAAAANGLNAVLVSAAAAAAAAAAVSAPETILGQIFRYTGSQMTSLTLDGCYIDNMTAGYIGAQCPHLRTLSVVGCKGLHSSGLHALISGGSSSGGGNSSSSGGSSSGGGSSSRGLQCLSVGGSTSAWKEVDALSGLTSLTELKLFRRSCVTHSELAPILIANTGLRKLALVGCYSLTDKLFELAAAAGSSNHRTSQQQQQGLQQLTHLSLTACDGMKGSSISRARGLRHLRISFCASISINAIQRLVVSCNKLTLLELPAQLQKQLSSFSFAAAAAAAAGGGGGVRAGSSRSVRYGQASYGREDPVLSGGFSGGNSSSSGGIEVEPVLFPRQGHGGHLHGLKIVCI